MNTCRRILSVFVLTLLIILSGCSTSAKKISISKTINAKAASRPTVIFYIPHADDEVLSMGMGIAGSVSKGDNVIVALFTDGKASQAIHTINNQITGTKGSSGNKYKLTLQKFSEARRVEFIDSLEALGVKRNNIFIYNFPDGGLTSQEVEGKIKYFEGLYPGSQHCGTSYLDKHKDHQAIGNTLKELYNKHEIKHARLYISPQIWGNTSGNIEHYSNLVQRMKSALQVYKTWNPAKGRYAIGYHSVPDLFNIVSRKLYSKYFDL